MATVSIGRRRLPPELIRWLATSGIMVTSEPVRDRMVALTRSMSLATSLDNGSMEARSGDSKGTTTAKTALRLNRPAAAVYAACLRRESIETLCCAGKCGDASRRVMVGKEPSPMRELIRTNDMVLVSAVGALLEGSGIHHMVLDQNMSALDGSIGALPRRLVVPDEDLARAQELLREAGLG